jgi:hypothetical protein
VSFLFPGRWPAGNTSLNVVVLTGPTRVQAATITFRRQQRCEDVIADDVPSQDGPKPEGDACACVRQRRAVEAPR